MSQLLASGIRDNYQRGSVGEFLQEKIADGSKLSIVSAYFTIYAFDALKPQLSGIDRFPLRRGDVSRADEVPVLWGKEKEMKQYGDAAQSDEATHVGEVG